MGLHDQSFIAVAAFVLGLFLTPTARRLALRWNFVDRPASHKVHHNPIPLFGGAAIYLSTVLVPLLLLDGAGLRQLAAPLLGGTLIAALGLWDDLRNLRPAFKFVVQILVAAGLILAGIQVKLFDASWANYLLTAFWLLGITNAFNLMDNMDGLSSGVGAVAAFFLLVLSMLTGQYLVGCLSAALLAACLSFLVFNFNPARIFMGDSGSLFLGFMLAVTGLMLQFPTLRPRTSWMIPVVVLGLPIFDTTLVTFSRIRRGIPVWVGGKDHTSHRLRLLGWSTRRVVLTLYGCGVALGLDALLIYFSGPAVAYAAQLVLATACVAGFWYCERLFVASRREADPHLADPIEA